MCVPQKGSSCCKDVSLPAFLCFAVYSEVYLTSYISPSLLVVMERRKNNEMFQGNSALCLLCLSLQQLSPDISKPPPWPLLPAPQIPWERERKRERDREVHRSRCTKSQKLYYFQLLHHLTSEPLILSSTHILTDFLFTSCLKHRDCDFFLFDLSW